MFWNRSANNNSTTTSSGGGASTASAIPPPQPAALHASKRTDWMTMPAPRSPSPRLRASSDRFVLSDQRRQELLLAARTNRVSWIDGATSTPASSSSALAQSSSSSSILKSVAPLYPVTTHSTASSSSSSSPSSTELLPSSYASIPVKFQQLLEDTTQQLVDFLLQLEQMKQLVAWVEVTSASTAPMNGKVHAASSPQEQMKKPSQILTICQEIEDHKQAIAAWKAALEPDVHPARTGLSTKCRSEEETQLVFLACFQEMTMFLKQTFAWEFVYQIQHFVKLFEQKHHAQMGPKPGRSNEPVSATISAALGALVHDFVMKMVGQLQRNTVFRDFVSPNSLLLQEDMLYEVLESFVMEKIHHVAFVRLQQQDEALHDRMEQLRFIDFHHLDLNPNCFSPAIAKAKWKQLQLMLEQMVRLPSPKRKMDVFLQVCDAISRFLQEFSVIPCQPEDEEPQEMDDNVADAGTQDTDEDGAASMEEDTAAQEKPKSKRNVQRRVGSSTFLPSADDFLPALIFLVLKTNPSLLKSQVEFIMQYRHPSKLLSKAGYFFTHLMSSIAFLEQLNATNLSISAEEFEKGVQRMKQRQKEAASMATANHVKPSTSSMVANSNGNSLGNSSVVLSTKAMEVEQEEAMPTIMQIRARRRALMR